MSIATTGLARGPERRMEAERGTFCDGAPVGFSGAQKREYVKRHQKDRIGHVTSHTSVP